MDEFAKNVAILQTVCAIMSVLVLILSAVLILRQVSIAARSLSFESILKLQAHVDSFLHDRQRIFSFMTVDCIVLESPFSASVPSKDRPCKLTSQEHGRIALTDAQRAALDVLSQDEVQIVRRAIGKLNDFAQLLEDGLVDERVFLSKYHMMALRLIHAVEGVRRIIEEKEGGDFGHRLLRLRKTCINYHFRNAKHKSVDVFVLVRNEQVLIVKGKD